MRLSIFVFLAVLFISCNNSGSDPDEFSYPFTNQTWTVESGEFARYSGVDFKSKAKFKLKSSIDTIFINSPEKYALEIAESFADSFYKFTFVDSTVFSSNAETDSIGFPNPDSLFGHPYQAMRTSYESDYSTINLTYPFSCDSTYQEQDVAYINYKSYSDTAKIVRVYSINVSGALPTVTHIMCEN